MFKQELQTIKMGEQIKRLEAKVKQLEAYQEYRKHFISLNEGEVILRSHGGAAQISLKKNGDIAIKGMKVTVTGLSDVFVKSSGEVILKGKQVNSN